MRALVLVISLLGTSILSSAAYADDTADPTPSVTASPLGNDAGGFNIAAQSSVEANSAQSGPSVTASSGDQAVESILPPGHWSASGVCGYMGNTGCQEYAGVVCPGNTQPIIWVFIRDADGGVEMSTAGCPGEPPASNPPTPLVDIPGEVLAAFKTVTLPSSTITVQPPGGETLVNFKTILSTQAGRHQINVRLDKVDLDVVLEVWPSSFVWHHGDGTTQGTTIPGTAWTEGADVDGDGFITHVYTRKLTAAPVSVDTTWSAQFKVAGDPDWRAVNGTVSITGTPVVLSVREASPELVTTPS